MLSSIANLRMKYTYKDLDHARKEGFQAGLKHGVNQGSRDILATVRTFLTTQEQRVNRNI